MWWVQYHSQGTFSGDDRLFEHYCDQFIRVLVPRVGEKVRIKGTLYTVKDLEHFVEECRTVVYVDEPTKPMGW